MLAEGAVFDTCCKTAKLHSCKGEAYTLRIRTCIINAILNCILAKSDLGFLLLLSP